MHIVISIEHSKYINISLPKRGSPEKKKVQVIHERLNRKKASQEKSIQGRFMQDRSRQYRSTQDYSDYSD